ncbi:EP300-interacting inhibitor of differentiation 3-like isoform X2 [Homarus americanus]|uniref:EP300-interacting inhibitor of differentiation 3-like isoform X2 n=1 Tax=Homarus americanus TaxID=6706 RepID=UPI001C48982D|nr:EP300-interacting inhibitor of differentiation 3-like isoform X2 [Homarus americanus]
MMAEPITQQQAVNMSEEANRQVKEKYRDLIQTFQEQTEGAGSDGLDISCLSLMVLKADEAFTGVKRPREAAMDAQLLKTCGTLAKINIESCQMNLTVFRPAEFAQKLIQFMTPGDEADNPDVFGKQLDWQRFGKAVSGLYKRVVGVEPLYGAIEWHRPKAAPRVRKRERDEESAPTTRPTAVLSGATGEEKQTEEVTRIMRILKARYKENGNHPVCFFSFIVNPESFSLTTENLFHTSFLLREQYAEISEDDNGFPVITPRSLTAGCRAGGVSHQGIISFTISDWKNIIETFEIKTWMIPPPAKRVFKRKT